MEAAPGVSTTGFRGPKGWGCPLYPDAPGICHWSRFGDPGVFCQLGVLLEHCCADPRICFSSLKSLLPYCTLLFLSDCPLSVWPCMRQLLMCAGSYLLTGADPVLEPAAETKGVREG